MIAVAWRVCLLLAAIAVAGSAAGAEPKLLPREMLDEGWIDLLDGETLFGWQRTGDAQWRVEDGTVTTQGDKPGWLMTTSPWSSFELHVEFKAPADTNSGVFFRSAPEPTDPTHDCLELNIAPANNPFPTGSLVGRRKVTLAKDRFPKPDEWHSLEVLAEGDTIWVKVDGRGVMKYGAPRPVRSGHIGLQAKEGAVAFRNIRLRPLGKSIFNGQNLVGWSTAGAEQSKFEVTAAGELHLANGPGQIATEKEFADFVLQLQCKVNGDGLNSGVFFRTLKEGRWQGYEAQINNKFVDGDRTKPADFGTGAIYRRQPARRVVPDDHEWFTMTVNAAGPHFAVWVDGYQVTDWTDVRPAAENPREGLRLGPGVIAIQGHDPTTDFLFREIRVGEVGE